MLCIDDSILFSFKQRTKRNQLGARALNNQHGELQIGGQDLRVHYINQQIKKPKWE